MARLLRRVFGRTSVPSAPTIVSVEATSSTSISIQWNASKKDGGSLITGYVVEYSPTSNPSFETQVVTRNIFSMTLKGLTPSTEYDVRVRGENAVGRSVPSAIKRTKTDDEVTERVDSVGDLEEDGSSSLDIKEKETDPRVEEEERLLMEATKNNDMNSLHRHLDKLERLLRDDNRKERRIKQSILCYAAYCGSTPVVEALIQKGVDINTMSTVPEHPRYGDNSEMSPLHWAADSDHVDTVKLLIEKGANLHSEDDCGLTPLHRAALGGDVGAVEYLIQAGADVNIKSDNGCTPLHLAAREGKEGTVQLLVEKGADINVKDNGRTPLHQAAEQGHAGTAQFLVENGTDINIKDSVGMTPLHWAAINGKEVTVQFLVEKGADINIKDRYGRTPLGLATQFRYEAVVAYLKRAADPNMLEESESTGRQQEQRPSPQETVPSAPTILAVEATSSSSISVKWAACTNDGGSPITGYVVEHHSALDPASPFETHLVGEDVFSTTVDGLTPSTKYEVRVRVENAVGCSQPSVTMQTMTKDSDNSPSEKQPATGEKEESDDKEIDLQVQHLLAKYRHQPIIKHKSLKCLFTGPPRVGKSTLKKRLLKTIKNLLDSGIVSPSGGLEKPITVIIGETRECVTVVMQSDIDWQPQNDLIDEAQIVLQFIDKSHISPPTLGPKPPLPKKVPCTPATATVASAELSRAKAVPSISGPDPPTPEEAESGGLDDATKLIKEVLASRKLHSVKDMEKTMTLYFMDTGGQPEFHDIMPIILNGPALHLIFFNLTFDLDDPISIQFCKPDGTNSTITYKSSYTGKQMIYQLLSSLYYLSKDLSPDSKPAAVLIATYLDKLKDMGEQGEKKIDEISHSLNELLNNTEFHSKGFLTYPTEGKATVFIPINNYSGDEEEIHRLQAFLKRVIDDRFAPVELPSSWLLFHLVLRQRYENSPGVCKLAECQALAKGCGLDEKDVPQVLQYIHRHLGTILFYEEVEGLNKLVICDPNVLFNSIYHLVAVSFAGVRAHHTSADEIRKTGEIPSEELQHISSQPSSSLLTTKHIVDLLKHFKILTEMVSDDSLTYFMPCLLHHDSLELSCEALKSLGPPPLLICFDGNYIPIGVFSALVVKLSQHSWEPDREIRYRNRILFHTDGVFPVELRVHPAYLEFHIRITNYKEEKPKEVHEFCLEVCKTVVGTLKSILGLHDHTKKTKFQLGFYCPGSFQPNGQPHFCGCLPRLNYINPKSFVCSKSPRCQEQCRLPPECTVWFDCWKDKTIGRVWDYVCSCDYASRTAGSVASLPTGTLPPQLSSTPAPVDIHGTVTSSETGQLHLQPPSAPVSTTIDILGDRPNLLKLLRFPSKNGNINIPEQISTKYLEFGILLLNDETGAKVSAIVSKHHEDAKQINLEILKLWVEGKGDLVSWNTLIDVLKAVGLVALASDIKEGLQH